MVSNTVLLLGLIVFNCEAKPINNLKVGIVKLPIPQTDVMDSFTKDSGERDDSTNMTCAVLTQLPVSLFSNTFLTKMGPLSKKPSLDFKAIGSLW